MGIPTEQNLKKIQAFCFPVARATAYTIALNLAFAQELDTAALAKVKKGIAVFLDITPENVDLKKASRRSVSYTATIYFADATTANTALTSLGPNGQQVPQALKTAGAPEPTSVSVSKVLPPGSASTTPPPGSASTTPPPGGLSGAAANAIFRFSAFTQMVFVSVGVILSCLDLK